MPELIKLNIDTENLYVTSDLHLNHKNIIKYCNRPFEYNEAGVREMNGHIHNNPLHRENEWKSNVNDKLLRNYVNCCADVHDFKPVLFSELIAGN